MNGTWKPIGEHIAALISSISTRVLSQVTAACPVFPKGVQTHRHRFRSLRPSTAGSLSDPFWAGLHHVYKRAA